MIKKFEVAPGEKIYPGDRVVLNSKGEIELDPEIKKRREAGAKIYEAMLKVHKNDSIYHRISNRIGAYITGPGFELRARAEDPKRNDRAEKLWGKRRKGKKTSMAVLICKGVIRRARAVFESIIR